MELIYSMRRKPLKYVPPHYEDITDTEVTRPICTISSANIIAFSSPTELTDEDGESWGGHVYVCDLDTPWNSHKVTSTNDPVSVLTWDEKGGQLLVATTVGEVSVFGRKDFLLNEWTCLYSASFNGERILEGIFYHSGRKFVLTDKKPDAPIAERVQLQRPAPTLKGFGDVSIPGALVVTSSGACGAVLTSSVELCARQNTYTRASAKHSNGKILVALLCSKGNIVRCASVSVTESALVVHPLPSIHLSEPSVITWSLSSETDSLLACGGGAAAVWRLAHHTHATHHLFNKGPSQGNTTPGGGTKPSECFNTLTWLVSRPWAAGGAGGVAVAASSRHHSVLVTPTSVVLHTHDTNKIHTIPWSASEPAGHGASSPKKAKYAHPACNPVLCSVSVSQLAGLAVCIDSLAQLHVYKPTQLMPSPVSIQQSINLLEYSMVSGIDALDLLLTMKPSTLETVYERITESFQRQPAAFQQYYNHAWLLLRIAICRMSATLQLSAASLSSLETLQCAWSCVVGSLRVDEPALTATDNNSQMLDKCLQALESKPEVLSAISASLSGFRCVLQRAAHIGLYYMTCTTNSKQGYNLLSEPAALTLIKKLSFLCRWAGGAALRPLSQPAPVDGAEEAGAPVPNSAVWDSLPRCCISAPVPKGALTLEYGVEPESLRYTPERPAVFDNSPPVAMDSIRYTYLGGGPLGPAKQRECGRCGAKALPVSPQATQQPAARYLAASFLHACRCGGPWTLVSNVPL